VTAQERGFDRQPKAGCLAVSAFQQRLFQAIKSGGIGGPKLQRKCGPARDNIEGSRSELHRADIDCAAREAIHHQLAGRQGKGARPQRRSCRSSIGVVPA